MHLIFEKRFASETVIVKLLTPYLKSLWKIFLQNNSCLIIIIHKFFKLSKNRRASLKRFPCSSCIAGIQVTVSFGRII